MSNSLLESYVHVVYKNKKKIENTFLKNIFSTNQNFQISNFSISETTDKKSTFSNFQISNVSISEKCKNIFKIFRKLFGKCLELSERRTLYFRMGFIVKVSKEPIIIQPFHFVMLIFTFSGCPGSMENHGEPTYFP